MTSDMTKKNGTVISSGDYYHQLREPGERRKMTGGWLLVLIKGKRHIR